MAASASKKRSATVFSRDEIGVEQLQSLKEKFADGDLNEKEFVSLFREIIDSSLSETQLIELYDTKHCTRCFEGVQVSVFQKIDANSDGTVDWDELTNYMFLSGSDNGYEFIGDDCNTYYETSQPEGNKAGDHLHHVADGSGDGNGPALRSFYHHKDIITRVLRLEKPYLYLTASKDGSVRTWNGVTMAPQSIITTGKNWITDCCVMRRSNRLAVASMNRTLGIYDLNSNQLIGEIYEYSKKQCIPLCLEYVEKPADDREALVVGDDTGGITVMTCSNQWLSCDGRSTTSTATASNSSGASSGGSIGSNISGGGSSSNNPTNAAGSASLEAQGFSSRTKFKKHTDWVTRVKWVNDIRAIVATSLDTNISIIDIDRMVVKFEYNRHKKGVFDLVWCSSTRLIASCGMERDISIWNPYSSQRAVATLRGHTSSVLHLASDDDNYQIISASSDNTFKVWDVRNHRCLQTFVDRYKSTGGAENRISALLYDPKYPCLISGTTHLTRWPFKVQVDDDHDPASDTKERPMCIATYNSVFHQVVTAEMSAESIVKTWSAETGDEICSFANAHRQSPVTAISFDYPGRRLLTGGHDGHLLKMWNFSNGALVKQFLKHEDSSSTTSSSLPTATAATASSSSSSLAKKYSASASIITSTSSASENPTTSPTAIDTTGIVASPVKRKVRDIMMLPASFGIDNEGRRGGPIDHGELPSPTKVRLERGHDELLTIGSARDVTTTPRKPMPPQSSSVEVRDQSATADGPEKATDENGTSTRPRRHPTTMNRNYRQQEVTSILDIERNLRVGMGDFICQRFVCSVGWDRNIFVWADKNDESEALPIHVLPNAKTLHSNPTKCHSMDILALVYIPPAYIATAGLDGKILLWSLNSGEYVSQLHQSTGSIDTMCYAQKLEMLFASGENGHLVCVDRSMITQAVIKLDHPQDEAITALQCDKTNTHLVTCDAAGYVKVWDLSVSPEHEGVTLAYCCHWRLGCARIIGADFIENARVSELYLLLSCGNGEVSVWTLDGVLVGIFGKHHAWQLGRPATYASSTSSCMWPPSDSLSGLTTKTSTVTSPAAQKHFIRCYSIASLNSNGNDAKETFLLEDSMPKPGEVWICVSGHRSRVMTMNAKKQESNNNTSSGSSAILHTGMLAATAGSGFGSSSASIMLPRRQSNSNRFLSSNAEPQRENTLSSLPFLQQKLAENAGEITELITVIKVTRGEISCWDGHGSKTPVLKVIEMSDFVRKAGWTKQTLLSQFIGRIFVDDPSCFRIQAICMNPLDPTKPDKKVYTLIDTLGLIHAMRSLNTAMSMVRLKLQDGLVVAHNQTQASRIAGSSGSATSSPRNRTNLNRCSAAFNDRRTLVPVALSSDTSPISQLQSLRVGNEGNDGGGGNGPDLTPVPPSPSSMMGPNLGSIASATRTLPLIKPREKREMGGMLPKRSSVRVRHDASVDFRRIHNPDDIPKNFRTVIQQQQQKALMTNNRTSAATAATLSNLDRSGDGFDGVLPG
uniref:EF-hand domain-containing protein n=1 Tax=Globisporangium ultimum (strain ATCC 200006 / CBS 805.95 / DAOM BR144) TaxID=431595 RepID=K3W8P6_GLOUD